MRKNCYSHLTQKNIIGSEMTSTIKDVRAKLYTWKGDTQKIHENFCTNAADLINQDNISNDKWVSYKFLSWLVVEVETNDGHIGIGNAALSPNLR